MSLHQREAVNQPDNPEYRVIPLTQGQFATVDAAHYDYLMQFNWCAVWSKQTRSFYAARHSPMVNGKRTMVQMHREIIKAPVGVQVDHRNGRTLDNWRLNLRLANHAQNGWNRSRDRSNTSGYKGVRWHKKCKNWQAQIRFVSADGKSARKHLGSFKTPEAAHAAYRNAAIELHGEFANWS